MPKYRLLHPNELAPLEKEFIEFLILNGIDAEEWKKIQSNDQEKYEKTISLFSDVVFESVLRKIKFMEWRTKNSIQTFQCLDSKLVMVSLTSPAPDVDFTDSQFIEKSLANPPQGLKVSTASRNYKSTRESDLFDMLQSGCLITDGVLFKTLSLMLSA